MFNRLYNIYNKIIKYRKLTPKQLTYLREDLPYLTWFMETQKVSLVDIQINDEQFPPYSLMYYFDDNLGGYTLKGIKNTLNEEECPC